MNKEALQKKAEEVYPDINDPHLGPIKRESLNWEQERLRKAFTAGAEYVAAEVERLKGELEAPKWIPVSERLPEEGGRYWCYVRELTDLGFSYFQWNCAYNAKEKRFTDSTLTNGENVTHWMPLPEKPNHE